MNCCMAKNGSPSLRYELKLQLHVIDDKIIELSVHIREHNVYSVVERHMVGSL